MGVDTPAQKRLPLTIQQIQLKIDIFTSKTGKHDAYHTLTDAYHDPKTLTEIWGLTHPHKNAYRLPYSKFNEYVYIQIIAEK